MNKYILLGLIALLLVALGFWWLLSTPASVEPVASVNPPPDIEVPEVVAEATEDPEENVFAPARLLVGSWRWEETVMNDGSTVTPKQPGAFTISFDSDGQVSGTTDCNNFTGGYTLTDDTLATGPYAMTRMFCEGSEEQTFIEMVSGTSTIMVTESGQFVILLPDESGSVVFSRMIN